MNATIATSPGDVLSRRTFAQKLKTATWQYGICVFGGMFVVLVYAVLERFPAIGAGVAALIVCGLLGLIFIKVSIKGGRSWAAVVGIGPGIASVLQAFRQIIR